MILNIAPRLLTCQSPITKRKRKYVVEKTTTKLKTQRDIDRHSRNTSFPAPFPLDTHYNTFKMKI
jgi:hypothetical protein